MLLFHTNLRGPVRKDGALVFYGGDRKMEMGMFPTIGVR